MAPLDRHNDHHHDHGHNHGGMAGEDQSDYLVDPGTEALAAAVRKMFIALKIVMVCVLIYFFFSGLYMVEQNEQAVVLRFGKVVGSYNTRIKQPGWHWAWPRPIEEVVIIPSSSAERQLNVDSFWYYQTDQEKLGVAVKRFGPKLQFVMDGYALTASSSAATVLGTEVAFTGGPSSLAKGQSFVTDYNIAHTRWKVRYSVSDPIRFAEQLWNGTDAGWAEVERLIESLLADAVIVTCANRDIEWILWDAPIQFSSLVQSELSNRLELLEVGLIAKLDLIDRVQPGQVKSAFDAAQSAGVEKKKLVTLATAEASELRNQAYSSSDIMVAQAEAYRKTIVTAAAADAEYIRELLDQIDRTARQRVAETEDDYRSKRRQVAEELLAVAVDQLYQETLREVIGGAEEVFVLNSGEGKSVQWRPILSRDATLKKAETDYDNELGRRGIPGLK